MILQRVTAPLVEPVDLATAKRHLRVDVPDDDDTIAAMITAAREHVEHITGRALLTQTWDYSLDRWPAGTFIKLPLGNLASVTSVKWKDDDGTETTLTLTTDYLVELNGDRCGRIVLPYAGVWPTGTLYPSNPITIRFICGWTRPDLVPFTIKAAILMQIADLYENRESQLVANMTQAYSENKTVSNLLTDHCLWDMS